VKVAVLKLEGTLGNRQRQGDLRDDAMSFLNAGQLHTDTHTNIRIKERNY